jgi:hypothetical protein
MRAKASQLWLLPDAWPPALMIVAPFFVNKLIYAYSPGHRTFLITYATYWL